MEDRPLIPIRTYTVVYVCLMILWGLNMGLAYIFMGRYWNNAISLSIATTQFMLVFLFFMHVRYYRYPLIRYFAFAGLFWVGILLVLTMSDYLTRNRPAGVNPRGEPVFVKER